MDEQQTAKVIQDVADVKRELSRLVERFDQSRLVSDLTARLEAREKTLAELREQAKDQRFAEMDAHDAKTGGRSPDELLEELDAANKRADNNWALYQKFEHAYNALCLDRRVAPLIEPEQAVDPRAEVP
jgi:hypothetical protein